MELLAVTSSTISAIGHDEQSAKLRVLFKSGGLYQYDNVSTDEFGDMRNADSVGAYFHAHIRDRKPTTKIEAVVPPVEDIPDPEPADLPAEVEQVSRESTDIAVLARQMTIADPDAHIRGQELMLDITRMRRKIEDTFRPMKEAAHRAHKVICQQETDLLAPLNEGLRMLSAHLTKYEAAIEEQRRAEEKRLREAQEEEARLAAQQETEQLALLDAYELEKQGDFAGAKQVLANPIPIAPRFAPAPVVQSPLTRVAGVVMRETWRGRVVNEALVPDEYWVLDQSRIDKVAGALKSAARIPGVEFYREDAMHGRTAAARR